MGVPLDVVVQTVAAVNPMIQDVTTFVVLATIPFNLIKVSLNYIIGYLLFQKLKTTNIMKGMN